ncbi:hypothetical protein MKX01_008685 [Papaver californicum]|nr:hypothetical protein MKX01_008685 [Papaver californicum]
MEDTSSVVGSVWSHSFPFSSYFFSPKHTHRIKKEEAMGILGWFSCFGKSSKKPKLKKQHTDQIHSNSKSTDNLKIKVSLDAKKESLKKERRFAQSTEIRTATDTTN